jgi:hypothetical protein
VAKFVARLLATAALWVRIQTYLKHTKWATQGKEWPTHSSSAKNILCAMCSCAYFFANHHRCLYCQEVDSRKVKDLEDTVRLKNKQIHQLLEDVDQVEQDNTSKIALNVVFTGV